MINMSLAEKFKEMSTTLLALGIVCVTFGYVVLNPEATVPSLMESWGNIAFGFFFGAVTTATAYKLGMRVTANVESSRD